VHRGSLQPVSRLLNSRMFLLPVNIDGAAGPIAPTTSNTHRKTDPRSIAADIGGHSNREGREAATMLGPPLRTPRLFRDELGDTDSWSPMPVDQRWPAHIRPCLPARAQQMARDGAVRDRPDFCHTAATASRHEREINVSTAFDSSRQVVEKRGRTKRGS